MGTWTILLIAILATTAARGEPEPEPAEKPDVTCKTTRRGNTYKGNYTHSSCQRWDAQTPNQHSYNKSDMFPDDDLTEAANHCRNPKNDHQYGPWCYDKNRPGIISCINEIPFCQGICNQEDLSLFDAEGCICQLKDWYGRDECEAEKSVKAKSAQECIRKGEKSGNNWVSYNAKSKDCKLYGAKTISKGVITMQPGAVKHYFLDGCDLLESSPYQQCLAYKDVGGQIAEPIMESPYSGFVCRKDPMKVGNGLSDIDAWINGGPITDLAIQNHTIAQYGVNFLTMAISYGSEIVQRGNANTKDSHLTKVEIPKDECINRIEVKTYMWRRFRLYIIGELTFHTNQKKYGPYGPGGTQPYDVRAPNGTCLAFMDHHSAWGFLTALAFIFEPISNFPDVVN